MEEKGKIQKCSTVQDNYIAQEKIEKLRIKQLSVYDFNSALIASAFLLDSVLYNEVDDVKTSYNESIEEGVPSTIKVMADIILKLLTRNGDDTPFEIYIEESYVEDIYRDSYYSHIASKHFEYNRYCKRVFFVEAASGYNLLDFEEDELERNLLGVCTIRPSVYGENEGWIGRTLIRPELMGLENPYLCKAEFTIHAFSKKLKIKAFPFMMQDGETITCAEATILLMMDYYGNKYSQYRSVVPSDVHEIVQKNSYQRAVPSTGITYTAVSKILLEFGFFSRLYGNKSDEKGMNLKRILHYYVDSAIPIAVDLKQSESSTNEHSVICIGYKGGNLHSSDDISKLAELGGKDKNMWFVDSADVFEDYIIMNDSSCPYANMHFNLKYDKNQGNSFYDDTINIIGIKQKFNVSMIVVPLSKRMFLEAMDAVDVSKKILADHSLGFQYAIRWAENQTDSGISEKLDKMLPKGTAESPLVYRVFLATSGNFKRKRTENFKNNDPVKTMYSVTPMPKFVWVCEIYSVESYKEKKAVGEIVLDATAYGRSEYSSVIIIHYPYNAGFRLRSDDANKFLTDFSSGAYRYNEPWEPINMYIHGEDNSEKK